tara:strand:+ start:4262 stop:4588 length:327 start_codon:yes stop_codon:yes gene_type:complete
MAESGRTQVRIGFDGNAFHIKYSSGSYVIGENPDWIEFSKGANRENFYECLLLIADRFSNEGLGRIDVERIIQPGSSRGGISQEDAEFLGRLTHCLYAYKKERVKQAF